MKTGVHIPALFYLQFGHGSGPFQTVACPAIRTDRPKTRGATWFMLLWEGRWRRVYHAKGDTFGHIRVNGEKVTAQ